MIRVCQYSALQARDILHQLAKCASLDIPTHHESKLGSLRCKDLNNLEPYLHGVATNSASSALAVFS